MKYIFTISIIVLSTFVGNAQKKYKRADDLFDKMWYIEAAKEYESAIDQGDISSEVFQKAGDAYYFNTDMEGAYKWYDRLISEYPKEVDAEYIFRYAHALQGIGEYKQAKKWMKKFSEKAKNEDPRAEKYSQNKITVEDILDIEPQFTLRNLDINTEYSDFGPMYYKDQLVYSSAIDSSYYEERRYHWNEQPFLSLYLGRINPLQTDVTLIEEFSEEINTRYHEATVSFSLDERKIYFTRNNYDGNLGRDQDGVNHLKLYSAVLKEDEDGNTIWEDIKELPFNSDDYSVGHPAVSPDGKQLYFVSDMPGSIGATDIFVVDILENDQYSQPRNLGNDINTYGREMFPYITGNRLYFASDGHLGLGGLDVFQADYVIENVFNTPINLGAPLNSKLDDFGFIIKEDLNTGFVCSNRKSGKGDDDIYSFERTPIETCTQNVFGYLSNVKTGEKISGVTVSLFSKNGEKIEEAITGVNGDYNFVTPVGCSEKYKVTAIKKGYTSNSKDFETSSITGKTEVPLGLDTVDELIVEENGQLKIKIGIIYFDLDKSFIRNDAAIELNKIVLLMTQYPKMKIKVESHTDSRSPDDYNLSLSDRRAKSTKAYLASQGINGDRIESAIGYGETQLINNCTNDIPCSEADHQLNRRSEFIITKI
ncbi:OmpA family protein [Aquimarina spongiae]|uniref:WD40-like Beta Propeller Repeat n=1 Tax=Aquimarina spongiae TaxID=570521 RepID=A0A1M6L5J7_9FLAO|nr:OmpA family protein [Aquimarina spongiae]SHJ66491.1 WD40-like Beta Propeller Repeat [Aquimarina spongiae]